MKTRRRIAALAGACGLALTLLALPAQAQNALGDGRVLDRNLQPGSGGINTRVRDIDAQIRFSNAIVTGNAPGLASFRGEVGYLAPEDFRGHLGSNDLFPFVRDAAPPAYAAQSGLRGTDALRYQFGLTTATVPGAAPTPLGFRGPVLFERAGSGATGAEVSSGLRSTSDFLTRQSLRPIVIGLGRSTADLQIDAAVAASPLIGVRTLQLPAAADPTTLIEQPAIEPLIPGQTLPIEPVPGPDPQMTGAAEALGLGEPTGAAGLADPAAFTGLGAPPERTATRRQRLTALTGLEPYARGITRPGQQPPTRVDLAEPLQLQTMAHLGAVERLRQELDTSLAALPQPGREADADADGEGQTRAAATPLEQRLEDIRRRLAGEPALVKPDRPQLTDPQRPARPGIDEPEELTPEQREARERERREAMRRAGIKVPGTVEFDPNMIDAMRRSRMTIRDLSSPSVADNMVYAENMAAGQTLLAQGRYFDAEERFVRAAAAIPGEPMAAIGRIHAQIGAGLFMSASMNLRTLLTTNPELLPARYGETLLPSRSRWAAIRDQLATRLQDDDRGAARAAALLLAYLGYQYGDQVALRQGIETLQSGPEMQVDSEAALVSLLAAVWLDAPPAPAPDGGE